MNEIENKKSVLTIFLISVFFSFINTPLYFSSTQISNQAFINLGNFHLPLQLVPLAGIVLFFLGIRNSNFIFCIGLSILYFLVSSLPEMPNHRYVMLFATLFLFSNNLFSRKEFSMQKMVAFSRIMIGIVYFFAFLAKLNTDYINPSLSCASTFLDNILFVNAGASSENAAIHLTAIYLSIIFEGLAFFLIFSNKFRPIVILVGLLFHLGLSFDLVKYFTNFSSTMYVLLLSSLGPQFYEELGSQYSINLKKLKVTFIASTALILILCILSGIDQIPFQEKYLQGLVFTRHLVWLSLAIYAITLCLTKFNLWKTQNVSSYKLSFFPNLLFCLFILSCLGPYLGLKTRSALTMYSNLRMEPDYSNHFIISRSANILGYLDSTANVLETNQQCATRIQDGLDYPLFELSRIHHSCPSEILSINYNNKLLSGADLESFFTSYTENKSFIVQNILPKLILFGPIGNGAEKECVW